MALQGQIIHQAYSYGPRKTEHIVGDVMCKHLCSKILIVLIEVLLERLL